MIWHVKEHCLIISLAGLLVILPLRAFKNSCEAACVFLYSTATQVSPNCTIYSALLVTTQLALASIRFFFFFQSKHKMCTGFKWSLLNSRYLNVLWYTFTFYFADDIIQVPWTVCLHWWIFILTQTGSNGPKKMRKKDLAQFVCRWHLLWYLVIDAIQTFLSMTSSVQILFQSPYLW